MIFILRKHIILKFKNDKYWPTLESCDLLVTDSYDSKSSKMQKARKWGIRIVTYQDLLDELD